MRGRVAWCFGRCAALSSLLAVAFAWPSHPAAAAQQAPAIVSVSLTPATATVGDRLTLTIDVDHDDAFTIEGPAFGDNFGDFELLDVADPQAEPGDDVTRTSLSYGLAAFEVGTVRLPPMTVRWRGAGGSGELTTPEQRVTVRSVLLPGETELRPLKPQLDIATEAPGPIWPATFVALFAVLTAAGYLLMRRAIGERPATLALVERVASPAERARSRLDALANSTGGADQKEYYAEIALTVRRFLSERHGFPAYAMTRRELQRHMAGAGIDRWPARLTGNLLEQCDAVQFAGFRPAPGRMEADLTAAYEIIHLTSEPHASVVNASPEVGEPTR